VYKDIPECKYNPRLLIFIYLKQSHLILLLSATVIGSLLFYNGNNYIILDAQGQNLQYQSQNAPMQEASPLLQSTVGVKITSPSTSQNVSTGNLTIVGTSSDTPTTECQVYADWNDKKPFQRVVAAGPEGNRDYSKWNYTYSSSYHEITNGTNELTSKISCFTGPTNLTKWYSINVTGIDGLGPQVSSSTSQIGVNNSNGYASGPPISRVTAAEITPPQFDPDDSGESQDETEDEDRENDDNDEKTNENEFEDDGTNPAGSESTDSEGPDDEGSYDDTLTYEQAEDDNDEKTNENEFEDDGTNPAGSESTDSEGPDDEGSYDDTLTYEQAEDDTELFTTDEYENDIDKEEEQEQEQEQDEDSVSWDDLVKSVEPLSNDVDIDGHESESIREDLDEDEQSIGNPEAPNVDNSIEPPFDLPEIAIPSNPPPLVPNLDEVIQYGDEDEDECDIDDAGFPFCDAG
jgi:hypothetical protein